MPITLSPLSRRRVLSAGVAAGLAALLPRSLSAADEKPIDPRRIVLLSDVHIPADKAFTHKTGVKPWETLTQAVGEIVALPVRPACVVINGDCAAMSGTAGDYANLVEGLEPLRKAGVTIHLVLGNHDARKTFSAALPASDQRVNDEAVADRHVSVVPTPRANLFLLDSLDVTNKTPGVLGEKQIAWLAKTLDAHADKPAVVFTHHDPDDPVAREKIKKALSGLTDTKALMDVLTPRKQVKAHVFGHSHVWRRAELAGIHQVNLPTTAWLFAKERPRGWVDLSLRDDGGTFELRCLDKAHASHGEKFDCKWR
ncbi:MAG TPA: metallophosphoesterase [Tepidisphaeraceae bacterium]|nr:metallophosphoesterase [Tepidisphaeraceae bacterium]